MTDDTIVNVGGLRFPISVDPFMQANFDRHYSCFYSKRGNSLLNQLCDLYGSDKGEIATSGHPYPWPSHTYADFLERTFHHCREHVRAVFECGMGTNNPDLPSNMTKTGKPGASLRVWRDYFPNAQVVGVDIDRDILFQEDRIQTFQCDQTSPESIAALWSKVSVDQFDLMVDDGLHEAHAGKTLLEHSFHKLKPGGIYIIEDVGIKTLVKYKSFLNERGYDHDFINLYRKGTPLSDNSIIVIRKS